MNRLLVNTAEDGSLLVVGEDVIAPGQPFRLVFLQEGHGALVPLRSQWTALPVMIAGRRYVVFAGEQDTPELKRVLFDFPDGVQTCMVRSFERHSRVWMSWPHPFESGMVVGIYFLDDDLVLGHGGTPPLTWAMLPWPPVR